MIIITMGLSFAISTAIGVLLLWHVWPHAVAAYPRPLIVALGVGFGAGISAVMLFLWLLVFGPTRGFPLGEACLLALLSIASARRRRAGGLTPPPLPVHRRRPALSLLLAAASLAMLVAAGAAFISNLRQHPHGEWDAWMNWDLRARMIFRGGEHWRTAFSGAIPWSHPDYPVLVPSLIVRNWLYAGRETLLGPYLVAATFTFGTAALLTAALATWRSLSHGLLAGLVLLSTPFFILHGTSLYADVPLGFFFLATMVCLAMEGRDSSANRRVWMLAGLAAGLAMWTKNEGTLFTLAVGVGLLFCGRSEGRAAWQSRLPAFGVGLLPMLLLVIGFKIAFAPPNDLLSTLGVERTLARLTTPDRYLVVLREYTNHITSFGKNGLGPAVWVLLAYFLALGINRTEIRRPWVRAGTIALGLLLAGHFIVFVSMADELPRLLDSSLDRLLLQIWPSALFLFFMVVHTPEEIAPGLFVVGFRLRPVTRESVA
jgi:hypothetical protein